MRIGGIFKIMQKFELSSGDQKQPGAQGLIIDKCMDGRSVTSYNSSDGVKHPSAPGYFPFAAGYFGGQKFIFNLVIFNLVRAGCEANWWPHHSWYHYSWILIWCMLFCIMNPVPPLWTWSLKGTPFFFVLDTPLIWRHEMCMIWLAAEWYSKLRSKESCIALSLVLSHIESHFIHFGIISWVFLFSFHLNFIIFYILLTLNDLLINDF